MRSLLALVVTLIVVQAAAAQSRMPASRRPAAGRPAVQRESGGAEAEAEGTLRRNKASSPGDAPYALVDEQGRLLYQVQPQGGVPLGRMVGRRVTLTGAKASSAGGRAPVFTAGAVEPSGSGAVKSGREIASQASYDAEGDRAAVGVPVAHRYAEGTESNYVQDGDVYYEGPADGNAAQQYSPLGGQAFNDQCNMCDGYGCDFCGRNSCLSGFYGRGEYLFWFPKGMYTPALVSTSPVGTTRANAGVLGVPGTDVLFGQQGLNNNGRSGGRINLGYWFDNCRNHAIEGDYWALGGNNDSYLNTSGGSPILARPYYDIVGGTESSELVAFPNVLRGSVAVDTNTSLQGGGLRKRWNLACCGTGDPCFGGGWRYDVTAGYRFMRLDDRISIREDLTSLDTTNPGSFVVFDQFRTQNTFNGAEIGGIFQSQRGRWSYEFLTRLALGSTHSTVNINGFTDITPPGGPTTRSTGGLLAQRTNIGSYERDNFAIVPELGLTGGYQLTNVWRVTFGYSFIYWSNVVRAGQQIDRDVNPNLLAPEANPFSGPLRPAFAFQQTDFWVQGVNVGLDARW